MDRVVSDDRFWRGKRVLVTGHTGFKGGWLSLWLARRGADVVGYALDPPTQPSLFEATAAQEVVRSTIADICDKDRLVRTVRDHRPQIVFHLAAQPLVSESHADPVETYRVNVLGTAYLLDALRRCDECRVIVNITSDKCYLNQEWPWPYRETDTLGGRDPYSSSKACSEILTAAFRHSFFRDPSSAIVASARAGNAICGGDWAKDRLIPDLYRARAAGRPLGLRRPQAVRPWQHVLEPLRGYMVLAEAMWNGGAAFAEGWNFGPKDEDFREVRWIAGWFATAYGDPALWQPVQAPPFGEASQLKLDYAKAATRLGWQPHWPLEVALQSIVAWQRAYEGGADMRAVTESQIAEYERTLTPSTARPDITHGQAVAAPH